MATGKLRPTKRGMAAVAAALIFAAVTGWTAFVADRATPGRPEIVHAAVDKGLTPPAVRLAVDTIIKGWEGLRLTAYRDAVGVWTIGYGETQGVRPGMTITRAEAEAMLERRVLRDYYLPLVDGIAGFAAAPDSVQAALTSGAYNYGTRRALRSDAAGLISKGKYREACDAMTVYNRAGGKVLPGLVARREMGDRYRIGEGELCVSGLVAPLKLTISGAPPR